MVNQFRLVKIYIQLSLQTLNNGWIFGGDGTLFTYKRWWNKLVKQFLPSINNLTSIFFVNKNIGWCSGQTIYKTIDGGAQDIRIPN